MEDYILHARQRKLLYLLNCKHGISTGKGLSIKLGVSERTIRNDIAEINRIMNLYKIEIKAIRGQGYQLKVKNRQVFHELFSEKDNIQTKEDRIKYLIIKLVRSDDWTNLGDLEDNMFISRTTLENDLKEVKNRITDNKPYISIIRKENYIKFEDDEVKKRNILIRIYCENWDYDSRDGIVLKEDVINKEILDEIRKELKDVLKKYNIELDDFGLIYLTLAIAVSYSRILEEHDFIEKDMFSMNVKINEKNVREASRELLDNLRTIWEIEMSEYEYLWIEGILNQLSILNFKYYTKEEVIAKTDPKSIEVTDRLLNELKVIYDIDFSNNYQFYISMILHIQALMNSMISAQVQSQYIIEELKSKYPFLGDIAHYLCLRLGNLCNLNIGEEEENYLLPLLILAQNEYLRLKLGEGIKVAIVSHLNASLTNYIMDEVQRVYTGRIKLEGPFPIYDREKIEQIEPSFILTTVQMDIFREFDIPVITISPLIESHEYRKIEECITKIENDYLYSPLPQDINSYIPKELILEVERKLDLKEVLELIEENMRSNLYVTDQFQFHWEGCYYAVLRNDLLFLYVNANKAQKTIAGVAICKHVVSWKHTKNIKKVILMVLNEKERKYIGSFYKMARDY